MANDAMVNFQCCNCGALWPSNYLKCPDCHAANDFRVSENSYRLMMARDMEFSQKLAEANLVKVERQFKKLFYFDGILHAISNDGIAWMHAGGWVKIEALPND